MNSSNRPNNPFGIPQKDLDAMNAFISANLNLLSATQRRNVQIVSALIRGETPSNVAKRWKLGVSAISNISKSIREDGVNLFLKKWTSKIKTESAPHPRKRGRKGIDTMMEWIAKSPAPNCDLVDIIYGSVGHGELQVVLAFKAAEGPGDLPDNKKHLERIISEFKSGLSGEKIQKSPWNDWNLFDVEFAKVLHLLKEASSRATVSDLPVPNYSDFIDDLRNFGEYSHIEFLCFGVESYSKAQTLAAFASLSRTITCEIRRFSDADDLVQSLYGAIGLIRESWNGVGLLPCIPELSFHLTSWQEEGFKGRYRWWTPLEGVYELARQSLIYRRYHALFGGIFELDLKTRSVLPWRDDFILETISLRPRIDVYQDPIDSQNSVISIQGLPDLSLDLVGPKMYSNVEEQAKKYRSNLKKISRSLKFRYSNRDHCQQSFVGMLVSMIDGEKHDANLDISCPCVLVPRHWLGREPDSAIYGSKINWLTMEQGVNRIKFQSEGNEVFSLVYYAPLVLQAVRCACESNWYGDYLNLMEWQQLDFHRHVGTASSQPFQAHGFVRVRHSIEHWCLDRESVCPKERHRDAFRWEAFREFQEQSGSQDKYPIVDAETCFSSILEDLDADMLLLGVDKQLRQKIDILEEAWVFEIKDLIAKRFDLGTPEGRDAILISVRHRWRGEMRRRWSEVESIFQSSLEAFGTSCKRVTRYAIENAQRRLLRGEEPLVVHIESEDRILKRWIAFFGKHITGTLQSSDSTVEFNENEMYQPGVAMTSESFEIQEVVGLIETLRVDSSNLVALSEFIEFAREVNVSLWQEVQLCFSSEEDGQGVNAAVMEAVKASRGDYDQDKKLTIIQEAFKKLG